MVVHLYISKHTTGSRTMATQAHKHRCERLKQESIDRVNTAKFIAAFNGENWGDALDREDRYYEESGQAEADMWDEMYGPYSDESDC